MCKLTFSLVISHSEQPAEWASAVFIVLVHGLGGVVVLSLPWPVVVSARLAIDAREGGFLSSLNEISACVLPFAWPDSSVLVHANMLEEQSLVASFARGELGEKLDLANLDALSRLLQEIQLTLWRSPGVDVHHLDFVVAVTSALRVGALAIEVGSDGLMPREISISRVVVRHTLVLQLEWEPVIGANLRRVFVCRLVNRASLRGRSIYIFEECRSDDGCRIRSIASL